MTPSNHKTPQIRLAFARLSAFCILVFERLWPLLLPSILIALLLMGLSWIGFFNLLSFWPHAIILWLLLFALVIALIPLRHLRLPNRHDIEERIEQASALSHQPLEVQHDNITNANANDATAALWHEHQKRMAQKIEHLQIGLPHPDIPRRDPYALRSLVILFAALGFMVSFGSHGGRLTDVLDFRPSTNTTALRIDGWVTPPDYTHQPPIFLTSGQAETQSLFIVPAGSHLTLRSYDVGTNIKATLEDENGDNYKLAAKPEIKNKNIISFETILNQTGTLNLSARHYEKHWNFVVTPDNPPSITLTTNEPGRILNGSIELEYRIDDDYGATKAWAEIKPLEHPNSNAHPLYNAPEIQLDLPRGGKGTGRTVRDISSHPFAGSEVALTLVVEDGAGHQSRSKSYIMTLPQRSFGNPLARAVVEQRRLLAINAFNRNRVLDMISALLVRPADTIDNATHVLALQSAKTRLSLSMDGDHLRDVADYMWQIALGIEGDDVDNALKQLRQAQAALRDALRNGASPEEIERLTQALKDAMQNYMNALAEKMDDSDLAKTIDPNAQSLSQNDLEEKLKQLEELAKTGNRAAAEQLLSELENMMDNLQMMPSGQGQGQNAGNQTDKMQEQMNKLGDLMRRQQETLNETHKQQEAQRRNELSDKDFQQKMDELGKEQKNLQGEMNQLLKDLQQQGIKPGEALNEAERKMGQSGEQMAQGDGEGAQQSQAEALEAMRKGAQGLMEQMKEAMKKNGEGNSNSANTDPLGRKLGTTGPSHDENGSVLPDENDTQRARRILDEIRKKLGDALTPEMEKQYLERLLKFD